MPPKTKKSRQNEPIYYMPPKIKKSRQNEPLYYMPPQTKKSRQNEPLYYMPPKIKPAGTETKKGAEKKCYVEARKDEVRLEKNMPDASFISFPIELPRFDADIPVDVYLPDDPSNDGATVISLALQALPDADFGTLLGMYTTIICSQAPYLRPLFTQVMADSGFLINEIKIPSQAEDHMINVDRARPITQVHAVLIWSVSAFVLFNSVLTDNCDEFVSNRLRALKKIFGIGAATELNIPIRFAEAEVIRAVVGVSDRLKCELTKWILITSVEITPIGIACNYLKGLIAWCEMGVFNFMYKTILSSGSRVILDPRVQGEVRSAERAFQILRSFKYSAFFKLIGPRSKLSYLDENNFPNLLAVAVKLMEKKLPCLANYRLPASVNKVLVDYLIKIHNQDMMNPGPRRVENFHKCLMAGTNWETLRPWEQLAYVGEANDEGSADDLVTEDVVVEENKD